MPSLRSTQADGRSFVQRYIAPLYHHYALDARYDFPYIILLLLFELAVGSLIIRRVAYTEIDWTAYMQQVELAQTGERDYRLIRGDTGPLVYPAGFLYLFGLLHRWTEGGADVRKAQSFFLGFYLVTQGLVLLIFNERARATRHAATYRRTKQNHAAVHHIWLWRIAMGVLCLSKRLHSIFLLRLFNDGPTMMLLYLSVLLFQRHRWRLGCFIFSLSVSLKMNTLLFAPGLLLLLLQALPNLHSVVSTLLLCCALPQLVLGAPFLLAHPVSYLRKAFELDRSFYYKWTVNWKLLPEDMFVSKPLSWLLLALHISGLVVCAVAWLRSAQRLIGKRLFLTRHQGIRLSPSYIAYTMFASNFMGIAFARTLHYQFYSWYFHAVPYLLWSALTRRSDVNLLKPRTFLCISIVAGIEFSFLTYPATARSSAVLQVCHLFILATLRPPPLYDIESTESTKKVS